MHPSKPSSERPWTRFAHWPARWPFAPDLPAPEGRKGMVATTDRLATRVDALEQSLAELEKVKGRVLGLVLNAVPKRGVDADAYGAHYGGYYQAEPDLPFRFEEQGAPTRTRRSERAR